VAAHPPTSQKQATDAELRNVPHLYQQLPSPIKKGKAPTKTSNKRIRNSSDEESVRALSADEIPYVPRLALSFPNQSPFAPRSTTPAKKSSGKVAPPAQKVIPSLFVPVCRSR
jgi:hypothetical protein